MALDVDSSANTRVGTIEIGIYLAGEGQSVSYGIEGMNKDQAIGYLTTVLDRVRDERRYEWATCPECKEPWASHFAVGDDDPDEDDLEDYE
jgi:hypothetical protein